MKKDILLKNFFRLCFYTVFLSTFVFGGSLQLFLGISNTLITYFSVGVLFSFVLLYSVLTGKLIVNKAILFLCVFAVIIFFSGVINKSGFLKTNLYFIYFLLPISTYLFFRINLKNEYLSSYKIKKLFFLIACVQLPIMIIQKYSYPILVMLNRSNQGIISADIMFGSFFLKADHALGLFLLFNIFNIVLNNKENQITKYPLLMYLYFGFTIMYSESNVSKLVLLVFTAYSIYRVVPKRIKIFGFIAAILAMVVFVKNAKHIKPVQNEILFIQNEYNVKKSYRNFERGIAKRPQVVISYAAKIPIKIIGDGPYSYFDILKGQFTLTKHFSQVIWTYVDLGLVGLTVFIFALFSLVKSFYLPGYMATVIFGVTIVYSFMTTIFSDIAILITLCGLLQIRNEQ